MNSSGLIILLLKLTIPKNHKVYYKRIVYVMDKKGQIEHLARGHRGTNGTSFIYKGI